MPLFLPWKDQRVGDIPAMPGGSGGAGTSGDCTSSQRRVGIRLLAASPPVLGHVTGRGGSLAPVEQKQTNKQNLVFDTELELSTLLLSQEIWA